jgi:hypothetical protein
MGYGQQMSPGSLKGFGTHYGGPVNFPYRLLAVEQLGSVAVSDDATAWTANGAIPAPAAVDWGALGYSPKSRAVVLVARDRNGLAPVDTIQTALTLDGDNWTQQYSPAAGMNALPVKLVWTNEFGATDRFYCQVRSGGANLGGVYYSDDLGATWSAMTWFGGTPAPQLDVAYMAIGNGKIIVIGNFFADSANTVRVWTSTDGLEFVQTDGPTLHTGFSNEHDGFAHGFDYSSDLDRFAAMGDSASSTFPTQCMTTSDGITNTFVDATVGNRAVSGGLVWMPSVSKFVSAFLVVGTANVAFANSATGGAPWTPIITGPPPYGRCPALVYSASLKRVVGGQQTAGGGGGNFIYTDDATTFVTVAAPAAAVWAALVATR